MAITRTYGSVTSIAKLAKLAGESIAARRDQERREESLARAQEMQMREVQATQTRNAQMEVAFAEIESRKQGEIMSMQWENQKMLINSQFNLESKQLEERAQQGYELRKKMQKQQSYDLIEEKLRKEVTDRTISEPQYNDLKRRAYFNIFGDIQLPVEKQLTPEEQFKQQLYQQALTPQPTQQTIPVAPVTAGRIRVINPQGQTVDIDKSAWKEAKGTYKLAPGQKSPEYLGYENEWVKDEIGRLSQAQEQPGLNPATYFGAKQELDKLIRKYPESWKEYLQEIKTKKRTSPESTSSLGQNIGWSSF